MIFRKLRMIAATALIAGAGIFGTAPMVSASTVDIIGWDTLDTWRVASSAVGTFQGYVGSYDGGGAPTAAGVLSATDATGYGISPSSPSNELAAFELVTGITGFSAVQDAAGDTSGSYREDPDGTTWAWITAEYFSLKGAGYTAYFHNDSTDGFRLDLSLVGGASTSDSLSHVTEYLAPVPLPAAGLLLIGALGSLVGLRRRRKTV